MFPDFVKLLFLADYDGGRGGRFGGGGGGRGGGRDYGNGRDHGHRYGQRRSETEEPEWMSESVNQVWPLTQCFKKHCFLQPTLFLLHNH